MSSDLLDLIIRDVFWLVIIGGWVFLLITGLEADKPLSGGLPGHTPAGEAADGAEGFWGRLGNWGAWAVFGLTSALLPVILWWIFAVHER